MTKTTNDVFVDAEGVEHDVSPMTMADAAIEQSMRLRCDECDHETDLGLDEPADLLKHVGTACPKCGADTLTQRDAEDGVKVIEMCIKAKGLMEQGFAVLSAQKRFEMLQEMRGATDADKIKVSVNPHGGTTNIKVGPVSKASD